MIWIKGSTHYLCPIKLEPIERHQYIEDAISRFTSMYNAELWVKTHLGRVNVIDIPQKYMEFFEKPEKQSPTMVVIMKYSPICIREEWHPVV